MISTIGKILCFLTFHKWKYAVNSESKLKKEFDESCFYRVCQRKHCGQTEERDDYRY